MHKIALIGIAAAVAAGVSGSLVTASYKSNEVRAASVDPTEITLKAGVLPVVQVDDPF